MNEQVNQLVMNADLASMPAAGLDPAAEQLQRKQRLAAGFNFTHLSTLKITLPALQTVQTKMDICNLLAFQNLGNFVGGAPNFRSFGHGREAT